jgi:hypothetical protein
MRTSRRLTLLGVLTGVATFMPPYPSNANFPPERPPAATSLDAATADAGGAR